jgi:hypothetical protein
MPAFCLTAPVLSESEEQAARDALSPQEEEQIQRDMYGPIEGLDNSCKGDESGIEIMRETIETAFPLPQKEAYLKATSQCPELVENESSMRVFLQREHYDPWAAAQRLLEYWNLRKELFGPVRAYQPMTLKEAMAEDLETLWKGPVYNLPPDRHGRPVLFIDRIRMTAKVASRESLARCVFYVASVASAQLNCSPRSEVDGIVYLINARVSDHKSSQNQPRLFFDLTWNASFLAGV